MADGQIGVIFDCDGVLLDSIGAWNEVERMLASYSNKPLTKTDTDAIATMTNIEIATYAHERFGVGAHPEDVLRMINDHMLDFYRNRAQARPGVRELLEELARRGARISVASSSPQAYLQAGLAHNDLLGYFDAVLSCDDVGASKREPLIYQTAQARMGTALERTWGVEDSAYAVRTLTSAGFRTVGIYADDTTGESAALQELATIFITSFPELDVDALFA